MKQYILLKRVRFGIKIFFVCESKSGYAWDFFIYTGQGEESNSQKLISHASVTKLVLCPELTGKGYVVFMDQWYSSPILFHELQHHSFRACGTVDSQRKEMPKELQATTMKKGMYFAIHQEFIQQSNGGTKKMWQYYPQFTGEEYVTQEKLPERQKKW